MRTVELGLQSRRVAWPGRGRAYVDPHRWARVLYVSRRSMSCAVGSGVGGKEGAKVSSLVTGHATGERLRSHPPGSSHSVHAAAIGLLYYILRRGGKVAVTVVAGIVLSISGRIVTCSVSGY